MNKSEVIEQIRRVRIMPVIRAHDQPAALKIAKAIVAGGINVLEITMTVPNAAEVISQLRQQTNSTVLIGAGTVLDVDTARRCLAAGAQFIVSPVTDRATIEFCRNAETAVFPGAMTINEIQLAWTLGADAVKIFPAQALGGANYLKAVKTVLPQIEVIPTGGVNLQTIADFLRAGALTVGVGNELIDTLTTEPNQANTISQRAGEFLSAVGNLQIS